MDSTLSRQDTIPTEDPSWSYSQVPGPGQPAPLRRNEPMLYIPNVGVDHTANTVEERNHLRLNHAVDDFNVHIIAMCLKNLRSVKVHLPPVTRNSESMTRNDHGTVMQMTHTFNITNPDNSLGPGKVCILV